MAGKSFLFQTTKNIMYELGASKRVGELMASSLSASSSGTLSSEMKNILFVTDKGLLDRGLGNGCIEGMRASGFNVEVFSDVVADPPEARIVEAIEFAKSKNISGVVGFGGGSSLDVAKVVAFLAQKGCQQTISDIYGVGMCKGSRMPLIQVPTTAGTGSEVTPISIVTTGQSEKKGIVSPMLLPDWAVLDGELTTSLPSAVTAATGIDAMVHAIEAFTSKIKKNPLSDLLAMEALLLLGGNIREVCSADGAANAQARGEMLLGSLYAGMAFANAPVAAVHALAYPIGSLFHVPHGVSNVLMLSHVMRFNSFKDPSSAGQLSGARNGDASALYAQLAPLVFSPAELALDPGKKKVPDFVLSSNFADRFDSLGQDLGLPMRLRDVSISEGDIERLATEAMKQTRLLPNNPREVNLSDAVDLYTRAY